MTAEIQKIHLETPHRKHITQAISILKKGGVIVYPTDTIYGLGADILNKEAVDRIFLIKRVSKHKLLSFLCPDLQTVANWAHISNLAFRTMRRVLPGPYTFILPATKEVPKILLQNRKTVGIRIPKSDVVQSLLQELGRPILSTSVPKGEDDYFIDPEEIALRYKNEIDYILDAGVMPNIPSSIVDFTVNPPEVLREGAGDIHALF